MPRLQDPHFKAWVEVDGVALPEYDVKTDSDGQTVRCWIPSEEGKSFVVCWENDEVKSSVCGWVLVDGREMSGRIIDAWKPNRRAKFEGDYTGETTISRLQFGKMQLTDDESLALEDESTIKALGTVELRIWRGVFSPGSFAPAQVRHERPVHEKMKKAGGHRVKSGETMVVPKGTWSKFDKQGSSFNAIFQYRPKAMLQALEIMPRDPPPSPPPRPAEQPRAQNVKPEKRRRDSDSESEASSGEDDEDKEKIKQLKAQLAALKGRPKKGDKHGRKAKKAKTEAIDVRAFFEPGEIIDLT